MNPKQGVECPASYLLSRVTAWCSWFTCVFSLAMLSRAAYGHICWTLLHATSMDQHNTNMNPSWKSVDVCRCQPIDQQTSMCVGILPFHRWQSTVHRYASMSIDSRRSILTLSTAIWYVHFIPSIDVFWYLLISTDNYQRSLTQTSNKYTTHTRTRPLRMVVIRV